MMAGGSSTSAMSAAITNLNSRTTFDLRRLSLTYDLTPATRFVAAGVLFALAPCSDSSYLAEAVFLTQSEKPASSLQTNTITSLAVRQALWGGCHALRRRSLRHAAE